VNATVTPEAPVIREHHDRLIRHVDRIPATADLLGHAKPPELGPALDETCGFLSELLVPHMDAAERALYPQLERLLQNRHSMTPMRREHDEIRARIGELEALRGEAGRRALGVAQQVKLRRLLFQLYAALKVHLAEEVLYADMVEFGASAEQEAALATAMEHAGTAAF
jgi:hypothetical protein